MKTGFVTDVFSTLSGLASVAYGDPDFFREVQDQVYALSPTRNVDQSRPSDTLLNLLGGVEVLEEITEESLLSRYGTDVNFRDYVDVEFGPGWSDRMAKSLARGILRSVDSSSTYGRSLEDHFEYAIMASLPGAPGVNDLALALTHGFRSDARLGEDVDLMVSIASNNPQTKISAPPKDSVIRLESAAEVGKDRRGVDYVYGYLAPREYYAGKAYPDPSSGFTSPSDVLRNSVNQGYVGYPAITSLLEGIFNPSGAESVAVTGSSAPSTLGTFYNSQENLSQADRDVYNISLIGPTLNGYVGFDPKTMSNGDLTDPSLLPTYNADNPDSGLNASSRDFTQAFN